jgi:hypothetical protein
MVVEGETVGKMPEEFRMPDGTWTTDINEYIVAWDAISKPIETAFGIQVWGFDPGIAFKDTAGNSFTMPSWFAIKLTKLLQEHAKQKGG